MIARSLFLSAPRHLEWIEEDLPSPVAGQVLVETIAGTISAGTELPLYRGEHRGSQAITYPRMTGYESLARVVSCGCGISALIPGTRVVAMYGHRSHAVLPAARAIPVPADVDKRVALLAILACETAKGVGKVEMTPGAPILIAGAGAIGLLTLFNLLAHGHVVDLFEPLSTRRALALRLGARAAVAPGEPLPATDEYAAGFECSARNRAFALLQWHIARGGQICVLSDGNLEPLELSPAFHERELRVVGSSDGVDYQGYARWFFDQVRARWDILAELFEAEAQARELPAVFERLASARAAPVKVLVHHRDES